MSRLTYPTTVEGCRKALYTLGVMHTPLRRSCTLPPPSLLVFGTYLEHTGQDLAAVKTFGPTLDHSDDLNMPTATLLPVTTVVFRIDHTAQDLQFPPHVMACWWVDRF